MRICLLLLFAVCGAFVHHSHHHHHYRHRQSLLGKSHRVRRTLHSHQSSHARVSSVPVVLWHGMGDCCCNPLSMGAIKKLIERNVPGVYVKSLMLGENIASDTEHGFLANMNELVDIACEQIRNDARLQGGYHAVGFSQGGQFVRALAERCPNPPVKNLVSIGGQQQGVFGLPYCPGDTIICNTVRRLLDIGAYVGFVQKSVVQAQYWHDPLNEKEYRKKSIFLADINNERELNADYKANLLKVKNFVLVRFTEDNMVVPRESSWFGFYKPGSVSEIQWMNETELYTQDKIGLRKLNESGRLHFLAVDGDHLQIPQQVFVDEIIEKWLK